MWKVCFIPLALVTTGCTHLMYPGISRPMVAGYSRPGALAHPHLPYPAAVDLRVRTLSSARHDDWTDPGSPCTLAERMYALYATATQPIAAIQRPAVVRAKGGNGMTFDLPRGS